MHVQIFIIKNVTRVYWSIRKKNDCVIIVAYYYRAYLTIHSRDHYSIRLFREISTVAKFKSWAGTFTPIAPTVSERSRGIRPGALYYNNRNKRLIAIIIFTVLGSGVGDDQRAQKHEKQSDAGHDQRSSPRTRRDGRVLVNPRLVHHVLIVSWTRANENRIISRYLISVARVSCQTRNGRGVLRNNNLRISCYVLLTGYTYAVLRRRRHTHCSGWWRSEMLRLRLPAPPWRR